MANYAINRVASGNVLSQTGTRNPNLDEVRNYDGKSERRAYSVDLELPLGTKAFSVSP
jgi:hypothetical protein